MSQASRLPAVGRDRRRACRRCARPVRSSRPTPARQRSTSTLSTAHVLARSAAVCPRARTRRGSGRARAASARRSSRRRAATSSSSPGTTPGTGASSSACRRASSRAASRSTPSSTGIYREHPDVDAILHVHASLDGIPATEVNYPCGTEELAADVARLLAAEPDPARAARASRRSSTGWRRACSRWCR